MAAPKKYIRVKQNINHNKIGVSLSHFVMHIENKPLAVQWEDNKHVHVRDETNTMLTLQRTDVETTLMVHN